MRLFGNRPMICAVAAALLVTAAAVITPSNATTGNVGIPTAPHMQRNAGEAPSRGVLLVRASRATRIANCLRNASNTADAMVLECGRLYGKRDKMGHVNPQLADCYENAHDYYAIESASCRQIR